MGHSAGRAPAWRGSCVTLTAPFTAGCDESESRQSTERESRERGAIRNSGTYNTLDNHDRKAKPRRSVTCACHMPHTKTNRYSRTLTALLSAKERVPARTTRAHERYRWTRRSAVHVLRRGFRPRPFQFATWLRLLLTVWFFLLTCSKPNCGSSHGEISSLSAKQKTLSQNKTNQTKRVSTGHQ